MNDNNTTEVLIVRLDPGSLDDLARRVADLVHEQLDAPAPVPAPAVSDEGRLLSAAQVAARWGVDRSWVYDHADDLGVRRLGTGVRPRLRFDPVKVAAYLDGAHPATAADHQAADVRRSPRSGSDCEEGLPIRGRAELSSVTQRSRRPGGAQTPPATAAKQRTSTR
jgi:hypothetical protein